VAASGEARPESEIDLFMERVLDNRADAWRRLGDFILCETEAFACEAYESTAAANGLPLCNRHESDFVGFADSGEVVWI
jgi:hypothetical protein